MCLPSWECSKQIRALSAATEEKRRQAARTEEGAVQTIFEFPPAPPVKPSLSTPLLLLKLLMLLLPH
jgi:hypothetical protein